uniref:Uncharacterized protein n=1 Tax=Onchocerca volvulus TaxID=6282 RepID=A0A8R1XZ18_ONCVO
MLKRIKKIFFTLAITFLSFQSKKNVGTKQCHSSLVVVTQPEEMVNKHLNDNLSDFIFDDNYFEDSWGLHSDLFATYTHQMNTFTSTTSLRITTACNISVKIPKQPTRILKAVHLEDIEGKTEEKYFLSDEFSTLNRTDYNLNGFSFSNSFFENSYIGISIIDE